MSAATDQKRKLGLLTSEERSSGGADSAFGRQLSARHATEPCFGFGTATRKQAGSINAPGLKPSFGASMEQRFPPKYHETMSPGPGYYAAGGFSRARSSPKYHFSRAPRETTRVLSSDTPGIVTSWYGDEVVRRSSRHPNPPAIHFGKSASRPQSTGMMREFDSQPGPEHANRADSAVGRQRDSRRSTSPRPRVIGTTREQREKVFMNTRDMTQAGRWRGGQTPGTGSYSPSLPIMPRKRLNTPSYGFSRSARDCCL